MFPKLRALDGNRKACEAINLPEAIPDMDEDELAELEIRLKRPKSGLFNTPWKFKFTDIVNAINDAQKEFGYSRI